MVWYTFLFLQIMLSPLLVAYEHLSTASPVVSGNFSDKIFSERKWVTECVGLGLTSLSCWHTAWQGKTHCNAAVGARPTLHRPVFHALRAKSRSALRTGGPVRFAKLFRENDQHTSTLQRQKSHKLTAANILWGEGAWTRVKMILNYNFIR
jgi:hypothetical protein